LRDAAGELDHLIQRIGVDEGLAVVDTLGAAVDQHATVAGLVRGVEHGALDLVAGRLAGDEVRIDLGDLGADGR